MECRTRDSQRAKCYKWENAFGYENNNIPFEQAQSIVDHVWHSEGLKFPPVVVPLPKQCRRVCATGSRTQLEFPEYTSTKTILHELGHAMTMDIHGKGDRHGPCFVGTVMLLYSKYLNIPLADMIVSAREAKLKYRFGTNSSF